MNYKLARHICVKGIFSLLPFVSLMTTLRKLGNLLSQSVAVIEATYSKRSHSPPSLDDPYTPESDAAHQDPAVLQAATIASAAASQPQLLVRPAKATLSFYAMEVRLSVYLVSDISFKTCIENISSLPQWH